ncbi:hypothetical protein TcCL_ESM07224 [Trypanosoma cruzi]|nr:hypothetical protein TcCL_ESM07224 [Trypanosoma cruzi]
MRGNAICRDHSELCTISVTSGSLLPVVPRVARREGVWSRTVSPASTEEGLPGASVPVAESIETDRGTPPKDVDTAVPQKNQLTEEKWIRPGCPDRPQEASLGGRDRSSETDGEQDTPPTPGDGTAAAACPCPLLLLASAAAAVPTHYQFAVWSALRCEATVLPSVWPAPSIGSPIGKHPFQWVSSICMCCAHSVLLCV